MMTTAKVDKIRIDFGDASKSLIYDFSEEESVDLRPLIQAFEQGDVRLAGASKIIVFFGSASHIEHGPRDDLGWTLYDDRQDEPREVGTCLTLIDAYHYATSIWRRSLSWSLFL